jgi:transposase InsO family protein
MRRSASEKMEIIRIVQDSELGVKQTLEELGISRSTFYVWYKHYFEDGFEGLTPKSPDRKSFWNKIPEKEKNKVIEIALEKEDLSPRELACHITDEKGWFISESSVYRILKGRGLVTSPKWILMAAADEFKDKTSRIHQQWQTDFTYFKIIGWGWYYLATIMDDYSRYIIHWELCSNMESSDAMRAVGQALKITRLTENNRPRLLTDNGSCYVSSAFKEFIQQKKMGHVQGAPYHPQTQGKIERYHRTMKNVVKLENYYFPDELRTRLAEFVDYYNNHRYHESLGNITPASVYFGRQNEVFNRRKEIKIETIKERRKMNQKKQLKQLLKY